MQLIKSPERLARAISSLKRREKQIGFVPTMGYLHEGHLALVRRAKRENEVVVVSIFVNPAQFGPHEDLKQYPRDLARDLKMLAHEKINFVFAPSVSAVYPKSFNEYLKAGPLANTLCGVLRPGHFDGVVTVVKRLFDMVMPDRAYFGQKDYQQTLIIQNMIKRLHLEVRMRICPIVREKDRLARSSRNIYLNEQERVRARALFASLQFSKMLIQTGIRDPRVIENKIHHLLSAYADKIDYVKVVNAASLKEIKRLRGRILIALACFIGKTRLIDNLLIKI